MLGPNDPATLNGPIDLDINALLGQVCDYLHQISGTQKQGVLYLAALFTGVARELWERYM